MAQGLNKKRIREIGVLTLVIFIFVSLVYKYIVSGIESKFQISRKIHSVREDIREESRENNVKCSVGEIKIVLVDGEICRKKIYDENKKDKWLKIYDSYPKFSQGKSTIYDFMNKGSMKSANEYTKNIVKIDRFEPITIEKFTWEEDPYKDRYWRFKYYSLRGMRHLIYAYKKTGNTKYIKKMSEIVESFLDTGMKKNNVWDDYHAVSFRTMVLTDVWWELRQNNKLSVELNEKLLKAIEIHGEFLLKEEHYEGEYNHGISEAAALLLVGINFPDFDNSEIYKKIARERLETGIQNIVDDDGVLIENSPYYHFYALEKYWDIKKYLVKFDDGVSQNYQNRLEKMISYATHILQPNLRVPLMGASIDRLINNKNAFAEIAQENPEFLYVLSEGRDGKEPSKLNMYYKKAGKVIMRSAWQKKEKFDNKFKNQTQVIFDVGAYRTDHSDLDALTFNLYGNGKPLITDTGLYTYSETNNLKDYFHGTRGHNTVVVDGLDQQKGSTSHNSFFETQDFVTHFSEHELYSQVHHQRSITLLKKDAVVIIDRLYSRGEHDYEQLFHLFAGANVDIKNNKTIIKNNEGNEEFSIYQMNIDDLETKKTSLKDDKLGDLCSLEYGKLVSCKTIHYKKHAKSATFVTVLVLKDGKKNIIPILKNKNLLVVDYDGVKYNFNINEVDDKFIEESVLREVSISKAEFALNKIDNKWKLEGEGSDKYKVLNENGKVVLTLKDEEENKKEDFIDKSYFKLNIGGVDQYYSKNQKIYTDLPFEEKEFRVYEQEDFVPILGYHHIISDDKKIQFPELEIHVSDFDKQISYLTKDLGCRWFTFVDIMKNYVRKEKKIPKNACVLNFDDGKKDHYELGFQTFKKYGAVATFYSIIGDTFAKKPNSLSFSDINDLINNGNEIGSHTVNSSGLINDKLNKKELVYQLSEAKKMIKSLGYNPETFAYPRGEQNKEIVDLTSEFYLAGRDTEKDNMWREKRPSAVSYDSDYLYHMNYHKPELETLEQLKKSIWYNTWWQFEEGFKFDFNFENKSKVLSSYKPTDNSYAVVALSSIGDKISNKFIVNHDSEYYIEFIVSFKENEESSLDNLIKVYVNDKNQEIRKVDDECYEARKRTFCVHNVKTNLKKGVNVISMESLSKSVLLDKFRVYRLLKSKSSYSADIEEFKKERPRQSPTPIEIKITSQKNRFNIKFALGSFIGIIILIIGVKYFRKK